MGCYVLLQGDLPNPVIEPKSPTSPALADGFFTTRTTWEARVCVPSCFSRIRLFVTLWTVICQAPLPMGFSGKNTGVGCHAILQGIFPTQGSSSHLLHLLNWKAGSLPHVPPEKPTENATYGQHFESLLKGLIHEDSILMNSLPLKGSISKYHNTKM